MFQLNLSQLINEPTHIQGNILDLVFTNNEDLIYDVTVHPYDYQPIPSDHCIISFSVTCKSVTKHIPKNTSQFVYDYSKADYNGLNNFLSSIDFSVCKQFTDIESIWSFVKDSILDRINTNIPKVRIKPNSSPKWFTSNIRYQIKCLRTLRRKHKRHPTDRTFNQIKSAEHNLQISIKQAKTNYEANLIQNFAFSNDSKIYQYMRSICKSDFIPPTVFFKDNIATADSDKANLVNKYFFSVFSQSDFTLPGFDDMPFVSSSLNIIQITYDDVYNALTAFDSSKATGIDGIGPAILKNCASVLTLPLHYLFSFSVRHCTIPLEWQTHCITPIFKSGDKNNVVNYRPISLLCVVSKLLERIIYDKVIKHISDQISDSQFGFMKNRSTLQQLLVFLNAIHEANKTQIDTIYLDFAKAFDRVPHNELLLKLWSVGITKDLWSWFKSYLTGRRQCVRINGSCSNFLPVLSGIPQGSILWPLLFLLYINDSFPTVQFSHILSFADDTKCFKLIHKDQDTQQLQQDLDSLAKWSVDWNLIFNTNKFIHLSFNVRFTTSYSVNGTPIASISKH